MQASEILSICRVLPQHALHRPAVKQALKAYAALSRGDVGLFLQLSRAAGWRQQRLFRVKLLQVPPLGCSIENFDFFGDYFLVLSIIIIIIINVVCSPDQDLARYAQA